MKILVIEDDADIASNIGQYFEDRGHQLDFPITALMVWRWPRLSALICDYQDCSLDLAPNPQGGIIARINFAR